MVHSGSPTTTEIYTMERVPVFVKRAQLNVVDRISNEDLRMFHERYRGTDKSAFFRFVLMTGHEILVQMRSSDISLNSVQGRILVSGIIANGSKLAAVVGSLFNTTDGWLRIEEEFEPLS